MNRLISNKILDCNCKLVFVPGNPDDVAGVRRLLHQKDQTTIDAYNLVNRCNESDLGNYGSGSGGS